MTTEQQTPIQEQAEGLTYEQIAEITRYSDAVGMRAAIVTWAQLTPDEEQELFTNELEPLSTCNLVPEDSQDRIEFYQSIASRLVREWKQSYDNEARVRLIEFLGASEHELFVVPVSIAELQHFGYDVDESGVVLNVNQEYLKDISTIANRMGLDVQDLQNKIGGLGYDRLKNASSTLKLTRAEQEFIDAVGLSLVKSNRGKRTNLNKIRLAHQTRFYYFGSGLSPNELMLLSRTNLTLDQIIDIAQKLSHKGNAATELIAAAAEYSNKAYITDTDIRVALAKTSSLPSSVPSDEQLAARNQTVFSKSSALLRYQKILEREPNLRSVIFTNRPGSKLRPVNITYPKQSSPNEEANVQIIPSQDNFQVLTARVTHELTHELQSEVLGPENAKKVDISIDESFAVAADKSALHLSQTGDEGDDNYTRPAIFWYQMPYTYSQLRFLRDIYNAGEEISDQELIQIHNSITEDFVKLTILSGESTTLEFKHLYEAPIRTLGYKDGFVYTQKDIQAYSDQAEVKSEPDSKPQPITMESLLIDKWGKGWLANDNAYAVFLLLMLESPQISNTSDLAQRCRELIHKSEDGVLGLLNERGFTPN